MIMICLPARLMVAAATVVVNSVLAATATGVANVQMVEDLNFADLTDAVQVSTPLSSETEMKNRDRSLLRSTLTYTCVSCMSIF